MGVTSRDIERPAGRSMEETGRESRGKWLIPRSDIIERTGSVSLVVDMPGAEEKAVNIDLENGTLTIKAAVAEEIAGKNELIRREFAPAGWKRSFSVSDEIDVEKAQASFKDGVLRIELPKSERAKPRKIQVKTV